MKIIINETSKAYDLTMQEWTGSDWGPNMAQWEQYNTDADRDAYDEDERAKLRDERPRSYDLDVIAE